MADPNDFFDPHLVDAAKVVCLAVAAWLMFLAGVGLSHLFFNS